MCVCVCVCVLVCEVLKIMPVYTKFVPKIFNYFEHFKNGRAALLITRRGLIAPE